MTHVQIIIKKLDTVFFALKNFPSKLFGLVEKLKKGIFAFLYNFSQVARSDEIYINFIITI